MDARARDGREQRVRHEPRWRGLVAALCASTGLHAGALALGSILIAGRAGPAPEVEESFDAFVIQLSLGASRTAADETAGEDREDAGTDDVAPTAVASSAIDAPEPELLATSERDELAAAIEPAREQTDPKLAESANEPLEDSPRIAESSSASDEKPLVTEVARAPQEPASAPASRELPRPIDLAAAGLAAPERAPAEPAPDRIGSREDPTDAELDRPCSPDERSLANSDATATQPGPTVLASSGTVDAARPTALAESRGAPSVRAARAGSARARAGRAFGKEDLRGLPELIDAPSPSYPANAVLSEEQGSVLCVLHVDTRGSVRSVEVLESSGFARLDRAAVEGLTRWRFRPFVRGGRAVAVRLRHRVVFRLDAPSGALAGA